MTDDRCDRCRGFGQERDMDTGLTIVCRDCSGSGEQEELSPWPSEASRPLVLSRRQAELRAPFGADLDEWAKSRNVVLL